MTFGFRFLSEDVPAMRLRLKVEINTREHFAVLGFTKRTFSVESRWYSGRADITTFELDELLATKLRALYQRRKGRDLFDLAMGLADERSDAARIAASFREYMGREGGSVTRAMFERNLEDYALSRGAMSCVAVGIRPAPRCRSRRAGSASE